MQTASCFVALGGDNRNTVPRFDVTAAELAVLRAIHGADSLSEVEVIGEKNVSLGGELARLRESYPARNEEGEFIVNLLYPGAAPRLHQTVEELGLADTMYSRAYWDKLRGLTPVAPAAAPAGKKGRGKKAPEPAPEPEDDLDEIPSDPEPDDGLLS